MVTEITFLTCKTGSEPELEAAFVKADMLFRRAKGCKSVVFRRSVKTPDRYLLTIEWEGIEDHTVVFKGSGDYGVWRALVLPHLTGPPLAEHFDPV